MRRHKTASTLQFPSRGDDDYGRHALPSSQLPPDPGHLWFWNPEEGIYRIRRVRE